MESLKNLFPKNKSDLSKQIASKPKYISTEFQDYGYRLAVRIGDVDHASMYIRMCKERPRAFIEQALSFVDDYPNAKSKSRLFLWKMRKLTQEYNISHGIVPEKRKAKSKCMIVIENEGSLFQGKRIKLKVQKKKNKKSVKSKVVPNIDQSKLF